MRTVAGGCTLAACGLRYRGDVRRVGPILALLLLVAACSEPAGWTADGAHVVDGHWVVTEVRCDPIPGASCLVAVDAAVRGTGVDARTVTAGWTADWPTSYRDGRGGTILATYAGLSQPSAVILDLADGTRHVVGVVCGGPISSEDGTVESPRTCGIEPGAGADKRVGHEPWLDRP